MSELTLFDLDHPPETRVTADVADAHPEQIHLHPDRELSGEETDRVWISNLGHGIDLLWSQRWDAGGYALRMRRDKAVAMAHAILAAAASGGSGS